MISSSNLCICRISADWSFMNTVTQKLTRLKIFTAVSFILTATLGTACHFAFDFFGQSRLIAPFVPVNESTWEHLKLLFMPALLFTLIREAVIGKDYPCLLTQKAKAVLAGMAWIVVGFYTYTGVWGKDVAWIDILLFYTAVALYTWLSKRSIEKEKKYCNAGVGTAVFVLTFILFLVFTVQPPKIGLFQDPQMGSVNVSKMLV